MVLSSGRYRFLAGAWLAILGSVACTERVPTTPSQTTTGSPTPTSPSPTATCAYEIFPTSRIHGPATETGTVTVTAPSGCAWTATSGVSWVAITSGGSGTGSGTVAYAVQANSGEGRTGTLTVAGRAFAIEQAVLACRFEDIADFSRWSSASGTTGSVRVSGQHVEMGAATGEGHAGIVSPCAFRGDFDVQVDYALINWPASNSYIAISAVNSLRIHRTGAGDYRLVLGQTDITRIATNDTHGQLRLARTGASTAGYYSSGSSWTRLGAANVGTESVRFLVELVFRPSIPSEQIITFDNFRINSGTPAN